MRSLIRTVVLSKVAVDIVETFLPSVWLPVVRVTVLAVLTRGVEGVLMGYSLFSNVLVLL